MFVLYWTSEDGQSFLKMGEFDSLVAATQAIKGARQEIVDQGGDANGSWDIYDSGDPQYWRNLFR